MLMIPVACPYTTRVVFDQNGLHEPFPETLVAYEIDDFFEVAAKFKIAEEIIRMIVEFEVYMKSDKNKILRLHEECKIQYPWFSWDSFFNINPSQLELFSGHALVRIASSEDFSDSPLSINDIFYFAEVRHHEHIINHFIDLYNFINQTITFLTKKKSNND